MARAKPFVGIRKDATREVFLSMGIPTESTHGDLFVLCIGPFRTMRGARFMRDYGRGNPHLQTVSDAEHFAARQ